MSNKDGVCWIQTLNTFSFKQIIDILFISLPSNVCHLCQMQTECRFQCHQIIWTLWGCCGADGPTPLAFSHLFSPYHLLAEIFKIFLVLHRIHFHLNLWFFEAKTSINEKYNNYMNMSLLLCLKLHSPRPSSIEN